MYAYFYIYYSIYVNKIYFTKIYIYEYAYTYTWLANFFYWWKHRKAVENAGKNTEKRVEKNEDWPSTPAYCFASIEDKMSWVEVQSYILFATSGRRFLSPPPSSPASKISRLTRGRAEGRYEPKAGTCSAYGCL